MFQRGTESVSEKTNKVLVKPGKSCSALEAIKRFRKVLEGCPLGWSKWDSYLGRRGPYRVPPCLGGQGVGGCLGFGAAPLGWCAGSRGGEPLLQATPPPSLYKERRGSSPSTSCACWLHPISLGKFSLPQGCSTPPLVNVRGLNRAGLRPTLIGCKKIYMYILRICIRCSLVENLI